MKFLENINFGPPPLLSKDRDNYLKLAQEHPQLKPIIDYELNFYRKGSKPLEQLEEEQAINRQGKTQYLRDKRLQEAWAPFEAIIHQEMRKSFNASTGDKPPAGFLFSIASLKNDSPELRLPPGTSLKEISPRHRSVEVPARYSAVREFPTAKVIKLAPGSFGLELVIINETCGFDYNVSHQNIVDKLCDWHKRYGIHVLEATSKSLRICFKNLPEDLEAFCKEATRFAPAIGTATETPGSITSELLQKMRETKTLTLYW